MNLSKQPYKGTRDFYPEDKRLQKWMFALMRKTVESFGYQEYDAPLLEPIELYSAKTGDEIVNEQTYTFRDRGDRSVVIRPEMTPSLARMVAARRQELAYPLRLYNIGTRWRYERPQRGRNREFFQLDVDLFGVDGIEGDAEIIQTADAILKAFGAKAEMYEIRVNSRSELEKRIEAAGVKTSIKEVIKVVDAFDKLDRTEFDNRLASQVEQPDDLYNYFKDDGAPAQLKKLMEILSAVGVRVAYTPTLARGFDYYTDIVFEVFDADPENNRAMFGGGRYDGLVGLFGVEPVPTVGFAMGDVTLENFLATNNLLPKLEPETQAVAILVGNVYEQAQKPLAELRTNGVNLAVDATDRKLDAKIKSAAKSAVKYVIFIGEAELSSGQFKFKDLESGKEQTADLATLAKSLLD